MRVFTTTAVAMCFVAMSALSAAAEPLTSKDGKFQIDIPEGWHYEAISTTARFHVENTTSVLEATYEAKVDFDRIDTLQAYAELTLKTIAKTSKLSNRQVTGPRRYSIGDHEVLEYKITGARDSRKSVLIYTFIESPKYWNHFVLSTSPSEVDGLRADLDTWAMTMREKKK